MVAGGGGGSPHFKLYPSEYYKLLESPAKVINHPEGILKRGLVANTLSSFAQYAPQAYRRVH